jgi:hypothetical protein
MLIGCSLICQSVSLFSLFARYSSYFQAAYEETEGGKRSEMASTSFGTILALLNWGQCA